MGIEFESNFVCTWYLPLIVSDMYKSNKIIAKCVDAEYQYISSYSAQFQLIITFMIAFENCPRI